MSAEIQKTFASNKIAKVTFAQMFREAGNQYILIPLGCGDIVPTLLNYKAYSGIDFVIDGVKNLPDFILLHQDKKEAYLIKVQYRQKFTSARVKSLAKEQKEKWHKSWLFIATTHGFYFDSCQNIIKNGGAASVLSKGLVSKELQDKHLELMKEFQK